MADVHGGEPSGGYGGGKGITPRERTPRDGGIRFTNVEGQGDAGDYGMVPQPGGFGHTRPSRSGGGGLGMSPSPKRVGSALNYAQSFDARAYAAAVASKQAEIMPALFKQDGALEALRPNTANKDPAGYLEVFPKGQRKPQLLTRLENLLQDKLRASDKLSSPDGRSHGAAMHAGGGGTRRNPGQANLRLDAHRQVLEAFIHAFTTYRPLLLRIKDEYDRALDGALRSEQENARMRAEIACLEQTRLKAVEQARADAASAAGNLRSELHSRLLEAEEREKEAIRRAEAAEARAQQLEAEAMAAKEEAKKVLEQNKSLKDAMFAESTWGQKEVAGVVSTKIIGPKKADADLAIKPIE